MYKIDPNFGTAEELKQLADELHRRDMVFVYDIVLNHMGPVSWLGASKFPVFTCDSRLAPCVGEFRHVPHVSSLGPAMSRVSRADMGLSCL